MASGDSLCFFTPSMSENQSGCSFDVRNGVLVLDFDAAADETCEFAGYMPEHYSGEGLTATILWMSQDQITGNCIWDLAFKSVTDNVDDLDTKAFAAVNSVTATTANNSGEVDYADITFTDGADMDSVVAGEYFRLQIRRDADNGSDTLTNDAELVGIIIKET